jgi:hypothetical protein
MRIRIIRQPIGVLSGVSLKHYRPDEVYDVPPVVADYLVMEEFAILEMRDSRQPSMPVEVERRRRRS